MTIKEYKDKYNGRIFIRTYTSYIYASGQTVNRSMPTLGELYFTPTQTKFYYHDTDEDAETHTVGDLPKASEIDFNTGTIRKVYKHNGFDTICEYRVATHEDLKTNALKGIDN